MVEKYISDKNVGYFYCMNACMHVCMLCVYVCLDIFFLISLGSTLPTLKTKSFYLNIIIPVDLFLTMLHILVSCLTGIFLEMYYPSI